MITKSLFADWSLSAVCSIPSRSYSEWRLVGKRYITHWSATHLPAYGQSPSLSPHFFESSRRYALSISFVFFVLHILFVDSSYRFISVFSSSIVGGRTLRGHSKVKCHLFVFLAICDKDILGRTNQNIGFKYSRNIKSSCKLVDPGQIKLNRSKVTSTVQHKLGTVLFQKRKKFHCVLITPMNDILVFSLFDISDFSLHSMNDLILLR